MGSECFAVVLRQYFLQKMNSRALKALRGAANVLVYRAQGARSLSGTKSYE